MSEKNLRVSEVFRAWGTILRGRRPLMSLEITRECPLHCPGCYAYEFGHLGSAGPLRQLSDFKGEELVHGVLALVRRFRPLHLSIVGGEPLVRYRELDQLLPKLAAMGIQVQLVTSAVRHIPESWRELPNLHLVVSIDGLREEHDRRRSPATYDRILEHIAGHRVIVHCTITRQLLRRPGYLMDFARFWSARTEVRKIWFSLYTPQEGDTSEERLTGEDRWMVVAELALMRQEINKLDIPRHVWDGFLRPPSSPDQCIFAQNTTCISADLHTKISPCQFGGNPVCSECGCMASAGLAAVGKFKVAGLVPVHTLFSVSKKIGERFSPAA
ncbi:MAG TPA: radical SAM protein [Terriglobia bacterium]|nr:radical SAM protein [Terriglobia bacterium]